MAKRKRTSGKKASKPSAKQLAARKKFAAAAKARSKKSSKSSRKSKNSRPVLKADKPDSEGLYGMRLNVRKPLKPRASGRRRPDGLGSRQDDVSKVTVRVPTQILEPVTAPNTEIDFTGYSRLAW